jgi:hypothetical protein
VPRRREQPDAVERRPSTRVLELAPVNWHKALEQGDAQQQLAANVFRRFTLDRPLVHCRSK